MQQIRIALRELNSVVLMGKNTMMRKIVNNYVQANPGHKFASVLPLIKGNVGFVFTNNNLAKVRNVLEANRVPAPARVGATSPIDVIVPPGPTECDPSQTAFFQTLQIATKIVKGKIEITSPVELLKVGDRVGNSEAALLQKLNIKPFTYGLILVAIYDNGSVFSPAVLNITDDDLLAGFSGAVRNVAALSFALEMPTTASVPHSITNAFKTLVSIAVECEGYSFPKADQYKKALKA
jgi:large subunit ribosomal protein LP0